MILSVTCTRFRTGCVPGASGATAGPSRFTKQCRLHSKSAPETNSKAHRWANWVPEGSLAGFSGSHGGGLGGPWGHPDPPNDRFPTPKNPARLAFRYPDNIEHEKHLSCPSKGTLKSANANAKSYKEVSVDRNTATRTQTLK